MSQLQPMKPINNSVFDVPCKLDENGTAWLHKETVARGLGFIKTELSTSGQSYIRWERVNSYLKEINAFQYIGKEYIPENVFYRLAMKANNRAAIKFQEHVANVILPAVRKAGPIQQFKLPSNFIEALECLVTSEKQKTTLESRVKQLESRNTYTRQLKRGDYMSITAAAKILRMSPRDLYNILREKELLAPDNSPREDLVNAGYFTVRKFSKPGYKEPVTKNQTMITKDGIDWLSDELS